jgi:hypothetical protein
MCCLGSTASPFTLTRGTETRSWGFPRVNSVLKFSLVELMLSVSHVLEDRDMARTWGSEKWGG